MGLFGEDKRQDERLDALEHHVRVLTETVRANQVDLAEGRIAILELQAKLDDKVSAADIDPTIVKLNEDLATARQDLAKTGAAASESWAMLQEGTRKSFNTLRDSVQAAADRVKKS